MIFLYGNWFFFNSQLQRPHRGAGGRGQALVVKTTRIFNCTLPQGECTKYICNTFFFNNSQQKEQIWLGPGKRGGGTMGYHPILTENANHVTNALIGDIRTFNMWP